MSADEFDPFVERLYSQAPSLPDADLFAAQVQTKLAANSRVRTIALSLAGVVGGVIAVRESLGMNFHFAQDAEAHRVSQGVESASAAIQGTVQSGLDQWGLSSISLGSMGGVQLFWITAAAVVAVLAAGVVRLSQEG
ncbi:MAG: hypothetical protein EON96_21370 [Caulobacteraceae bacterium]|nr:MAG: hypothetical protein EON96_21370 [Caulobacteraceae bacterium]